MIDKREQFAFWLREPENNKKLTSTSNNQDFFGKECTEEHNVQEAFDDYKVKRFSAPLDLAINE